ncbi:MAG TPA: sugar phosphate isomerase/epimerase, partial [Pirellulales bacterium]|nr:sugar phosphate isomerase/epimerase [Pirellulales bacterium]
TFLTSLEDAVDVIDRIASPYVRLSFDTYHSGSGAGALEKAQRLAGRIAIVHLADGHPPDEEQHRTPLGRGCVPLKELIAALCAGGYAGDFDVELFGDEVPPDNYEGLLRESKTTFEQLIAP